MHEICRSRFASLFLATACLVGGPGRALAQQTPPTNPPPVEQRVTDVAKGVHVLTGTLNNTTVVVGSDAIIVIDNQFAPRYGAIMEKIRTLSGKPIRYVVNTHYHYDHTGGNAQFRRQGVDIVAHANAVARLIDPPPDPFSGLPNAPTPPAGLPNLPYSGAGTTLSIGGVTAELVHPAPAHTDGDTVVILKEVNVIAAGDIVGNHYPNIDLAVGGGIDGTIAAVDVILGRMDDRTKLVPGHGPVLGRAEVVAFHNMLKTARERIVRAKAGGMSEAQVVEARLLADLDDPWRSDGPGRPSSDRFPGAVYRSLP